MMRNVVIKPLSRGWLLGVRSDSRHPGLLFVSVVTTFLAGGLTRSQWDLRSWSNRWWKQWTTSTATFCYSSTLRMTSVLKLVAVVHARLRAFVAIYCTRARTTHNIASVISAPMGYKQ